MPEDEKERLKRELKELEGKNVAHYSVLLSAWIQTRMERDKALITLSSFGVGLLVTLSSSVFDYTFISALLFIISFLGFTVCIATCLIVYHLNSVQIENEFRNQKSDFDLANYDKTSSWAFVCAVLFMCCIGIYSLHTNSKETEMTGKNKQLNTEETEKRSLSGLSELKPKPPATPKPKEDTDQTKS